MGKESAFNAGDSNLIPGLGRSPGGGHMNAKTGCIKQLDIYFSQF